MIKIVVAVLAVVNLQVAPPAMPQRDSQVAVERRDIVRRLSLHTARIFVAKRVTSNGELVFRYVELSPPAREQFISLLDRTETYYDMPGVIGCVGDTFRVFAVWPDRQAEAWFAPKCQRIMAAPDSVVAFDAALSSRGAEAIRQIFDRDIRIRRGAG